MKINVNAHAAIKPRMNFSMIISSSILTNDSLKVHLCMMNHATNHGIAYLNPSYIKLCVSKPNNSNCHKQYTNAEQYSNEKQKFYHISSSILLDALNIHIEDTAVSIAKRMIKVITAAIIPTTKYKYFIFSSILISISYRRHNCSNCAHSDKCYEFDYFVNDKIIPTRVPKPIAKNTPMIKKYK